MISVAILTYDDEIQIENCLNSLKGFSNDIVIIDSYSEDKTIEICKKHNTRIYQNTFVNQAIQFNWALDKINFKNDWILRLDSDEILPKKIKEEILETISKETNIKAYFLNRRMYWMGKWLKHGRMYPHHILRLFKNGYAKYEEKTEEHLIVNGELGYIKSDFLEDNKKNNLDYFTQKHIQTANGELKEINNFLKDNSGIKSNFFGHKVNRTRWLKENIYMNSPLFLRPFIYFIYRYFICLGFLDGKPGFIFHILQGFWYRFYIDSKVYESKLVRKKIDDEYNDVH